MIKINKKVAVIAPVLNEEAVVVSFYEAVKKVLDVSVAGWDLIFVDDGSTDSTLAQLKDLNSRDSRVKVVSFSRNFGHPVAISAGLDSAQGDAAIIMDADLQDPPEVLPEFLKKWQEGYAVVYGVRSKRKEWFGKRFAYWLFYRILRRVAFLNIPVDAGDFCLLDKTVLEVVKKLPERNRFMRGLRSWAGFKQIGVSYERRGRFAGSTKYPFKKLLTLATDGIFSFSYTPLRLATAFGFLIAGAAFLAIIVILYIRIVRGVIGIPGFASTIILILFIGGIQLMSVGILGEYVARIYEEVKQRPLYVIKEKVGL